MNSARSVFALTLLLLISAGNSVQGVQLVDPPTVTADHRVIVRQLLVDDWERGAESRANSRTAFESAQPATVDVTLAYLLNRIHHNQRREALDVAKKFTLSDSSSLDAWLIQAHLNALVDHYDRSLIDLRSIKKLINENKAFSDEQKLETYRRVGQLVGYLEGPVKSKVNPDTLTSTVQFVTDGATLPELKAFGDRRNEILQRYENQMREENAKAEKLLDKKAVENSNLDKNLTTQNQQIGQTTEQLLAQIQQLQTEGSRELGDLETQISPIESSLSYTVGQINSVQYDLQLLYTDLLNAQNVPPEYRTSTWYLQNQISIRESSLYSLQANANAISNQLNSLKFRINQTRAGYQSQIAQLQQQGGRLNKTLLRNQSKLAKIAGGPELAAEKQEAINSRLVALGSYVELPIELYRQQMLEMGK